MTPPFVPQLSAFLATRSGRLLAATAVCLGLGMLALGAYFPVVSCLLALSVAALLALFLATEDRHGKARAVPRVVWPFLMLGAYSLMQSLPLPLALLRLLSPNAADIWVHALSIAGGHPPSWAPLSLAPEVSRVEGVKWLSYGAFAWLGVACGRARRAEQVAWVTLGLALLAGLVTVAHGALGATHVFGIYEPRYAGTTRWRIGPLLNANHLSGYLNLGAFAGLALLLSSRRRPAVVWLALSFATCALFTGVVLLASRAGVALLIVGAITAVAGGSRKRDRKLAPGKPDTTVFLSLFLLVAAAGFAALGYHEAVLTQLSERDISKLHVARDCIAMVRDFWAFGVGRGGFEGVYFAYSSLASNVTWTNPENIVAQWLVEWGVPVSLVAVALFVHALRAAHGLRERTVGRLLFLALVLLTLHNLVDFSLEIPAIASLAAFILGTLCGMPSRQAHEARETAPVLAPRIFSAALAFLALATLATRPGVLSDLRRDAAALWHAPPSETEIAACRSLIARFPAEPYFPLTAGFIAMHLAPLRGIPWFNEALERAPHQGVTHLLVADTLANVGARSQARSEIREALERDPSLADVAAARTIALGGSAEDILSVAPASGPGETAFLTALAQRLPASHPAVETARERVLTREPCLLSVRESRVRAHLASYANAQGECTGARRASCDTTILTDIARLRACPDGTAPAALLRAEWEWLAGDRTAALAELESACSEQTSGLLACLQTLAERSADARDLDRLTRVIRLVIARRCAMPDECARAWAWASGMHERAGAAAIAFADASKAVEANPSDLAIRTEYARAAMEAGAVERAVAALSYVAERRPNDTTIAATLSAARAKLSASHASAAPPPNAGPSTLSAMQGDRADVTFYPPSGAASLSAGRIAPPVNSTKH